MAVTDEKKMDTTAAAPPAGGEGDDRKEPRAIPARPKAASKPGFFSIYKKSQGYWTRMGTVICAAVIGAFCAYNIYVYVPTFLSLPEQGKMSSEEFRIAVQNAQTSHQHIALGVSLGFLLAYCLIGWYVMNKPSNVEFLIATDVEMKKVNWTSKKELLGSTKVVIAFMFLTAVFLFAVDMIFRFLMQCIHVLNWGAPF